MLGNLLHKDADRVQEGVGLLSSILMRYAEVGSVHYWCEQHALKFTFMVQHHQEVSSLREIFKPALEFFHQLEGKNMRIFDLTCHNEEDVCLITITRDVDSMTQREVGLIVELIKGKYKKQLLYDELYLPEDEQIFQEEMITHMLYSIHSDDMDKNVVALREEGRVLVFKS
ncbi:hypothetical protein E4K67_26610 [Desulfosporosinus fructosivorans]|uniref:Uncharacterized protein n=1 Tax=Desulfosporosinus fructosivorans TaxID=2018669 RepID=A0A4Z0QWI7_9FIRM|nr:hypothetical protein [Desulfosporosinus fructosivorans]TGE35182.1 hypothetical protein E4K67_26610 [Desulfosporosinus fructosivorans]